MQFSELISAMLVFLDEEAQKSASSRDEAKRSWKDGDMATIHEAFYTGERNAYLNALDYLLALMKDAIKKGLEEGKK